MKALISLLFLSISLLSFSKAQTGNSIYSSFGIGNILSPAIGQTEAMGIAGAAIRSPYFANPLNPAANAYMQKPVTMTFDFGLDFDLNTIKSSAETISESSGGLSHMVLWMQPNRSWSTTVGLLPFSEVSYNINTERYNETLQRSYDVTYRSSGGTYKLYWGNALRINRQLSLGLNLAAVMGSLNKLEEIEQLLDIGSFTVESKTNLKGFQADLGLQYSIRAGKNNFILGATLTPSTKISSINEQTLNQNTTILLEGEAEDQTPYFLPLQTTLGLSWSRSNFMISTDWQYQQWSEAEVNSPYLIQDTHRWALGGEWSPKTVNSDLYFQQSFSIRGGFHIQNYYQKIENNSFPVWGFNLGVSAPIRRMFHSLNINYSFQEQGTLSNDLFLESKHRITVSLSLRDIWFHKIRIR